MDLSNLARLVLFAALGFCGQAAAGIYAYTAEDGSVALSNVPTESRFAILLPEQGDAPPAAAVPAEPVKLPTTPASKAQYEPMVELAAQRYGLESALLHAVISVESRYDPNAVSKKGAAGLMQLMPGTAKRYKVDDALDPEQNVHGGARYLRDLLRLFNRDLSLVLAAYNAGENAVIRNGYRIPPMKETVNYVPRVLGLYHRYLGTRGRVSMR